jgi:hypothetical protein
MKLRRDSAYILAAALVITLCGGYGDGWGWTGFRTNGQLWDWLNLLLLPVVTATIPLWIQYRKYIGRGRTVLYGAVAVAWTGFVIAGYLIPLHWTGFRSQTLWNWIELLLLPTVVAGTMALTTMRVRPAGLLRSLRRYQKVILVALAAGWVVTVIGGYTLRWTWTGYPANNTLWDWLQLLLLPLVFPTVLLPALLNWVTGDAASRASQPPAAARPSAVPQQTGLRSAGLRGALPQYPSARQRLARTRVHGRRRRPAAGDGEGEPAHHGGYYRARDEDRGDAHPRAEQRANAEGGDAVPDLVTRDDPAGHLGLAAGQLFLAEADRERQQRGAAEPCQAEGGHGRARRVMRQRRDDREGSGEQERQDVVGDPAGHPPLDGGDQYPADGDHSPETGQREGRGR